jgi:hypothetical protein
VIDQQRYRNDLGRHNGPVDFVLDNLNRNIRSVGGTPYQWVRSGALHYPLKFSTPFQKGLLGSEGCEIGGFADQSVDCVSLTPNSFSGLASCPTEIH